MERWFFLHFFYFILGFTNLDTFFWKLSRNCQENRRPGATTPWLCAIGTATAKWLLSGFSRVGRGKQFLYTAGYEQMHEIILKKYQTWHVVSHKYTKLAYFIASTTCFWLFLDTQEMFCLVVPQRFFFSRGFEVPGPDVRKSALGGSGGRETQRRDLLWRKAEVEDVCQTKGCRIL